MIKLGQNIKYERGCNMNAEKFLKSEIDYKVRQRIIGAVSRAYTDTEKLCLIDSSFECQKGQEALTIVRNLKVETQLRDEAKSGFLPFQCKEAKNCADNCTHHEFYTDNAVITVSRVKEENNLPRKAKYRENLSFNNQMSLFDMGEDSDGRKHILLTHMESGGKLKSLVLGIPSSDGKSWEYKINLLKEITIVENEEETLPNNTLKIRKDVKKEVK